MSDKALLMDGKQFAKEKQIRAKRPSEYWLLFIKQYVLSYKEPWFRLYYLLFLIPILIIVLIVIFSSDPELAIIFGFISFIFSLIIFGVLKMKEKKALVPLGAYQDLAKFIISIKGDVYRNLIGLRINARVIEADIHKLDITKLGLKNEKGVKHEAFEMERFKANFTLNDGSVCLASLHQIVVRVTTTKRRSSGKTKTKMKRKHKFFYQLALKLNTSDYNIISSRDLLALNENYVSYDITVKDHGEFCWLKIKSKQKLLKVETELNSATKHIDSIYTKMMEVLIEYKVMEHRVSNKSIKS